MRDSNSPIRLSVCLVVHNEEAVIERCLQSVASIAGQLIVIHDGVCSDATLEIAKRYGAEIREAPLTGVAEPLRPLSYEMARGEWILQIDADEYLSPQLADALPQLLEHEEIVGYEFLWPLYDGHAYVTRNWPHKRCLFRKDRLAYLGLPNFVAELDGKIEQVSYVLEHRPDYNNYLWHSFKRKWLRWADIQARLCAGNFSNIARYHYSAADWPRTISFRRRWPLIALVADPLVVFIKTLINGAWKEGKYAYKAAFLLACYRVVVDWKLFRYRQSMR